MRKIPNKLRQEMAKDPYYKKCAVRGFSTCDGRIEWHHGIIYAGRQLNEKWAILPLCHLHHDRVCVEPYKSYILWTILERATEQELIAVSKAINYIDLREKLRKEYAK